MVKQIEIPDFQKMTPMKEKSLSIYRRYGIWGESN